MTTVTILNGPPGCGKDTIARAIAELDGSYHGEFKAVLYRETAKFFRVNEEVFKKNAQNRTLKEKPIYDTHLGLMSPRDMLIYVSEGIIKPRFGKDWFGVQAATDWLDIDQHKIISDGGFKEEVNALCNIIGQQQILVIQLHRKDYDFNADSRDYISEYAVPCNVAYVQLIDGDIDSAVSQVQAIRRELLCLEEQIFKQQ